MAAPLRVIVAVPEEGTSPPNTRPGAQWTSADACSSVYGVPSFLHLANTSASLKLSVRFGWGLWAPAYPGWAHL